MRNPRSVKLEFFWKWMEGLGKCRSEKKKMSLLERENAIKLSADLAMASTRNLDQCRCWTWSRALIGNYASRDGNSRVLTERIIGSLQCQRLRKAFTSSSSILNSNNNRRIRRSRKILKRSRTISRANKKKILKRTRTLRSLVPGGDLMDDVSLLEETLDYVQSLRAQVLVMRSFLNNSHLFK